VRERTGARDRFEAIQAEGRSPIGVFVTSTDPAMTEIMGYAGYDFVLLDNEHGPLGPAELLPHVRAAEAAGVLPFVRMPQTNRADIQRMLDIGAEGLVVAHIESAEEAEAVVAATRYPHSQRTAPGTRGMCPGCHAARYAAHGWGEFVEHTERNVLVIPLIETQRGVDNAAEIAGVDGVDYVHFGPGDYSSDHGVSMDHPRVTEGWEAVLSATRAAGKRTLALARTPGLRPRDADAILDGMDLIGTANYFADRLDSVRREFASHA
jgi:2-keto-3-deoxy-L-rhamnonate aldolase RhmA